MADSTSFATDFDELPIPMGVVELDGTIVAWNQAAATLLSRMRPEIVGHKVWDFAPGGEHIWPEILVAVRERGEFRGDIMVATPQGPRSVHYVCALRTYENRLVLVACAMEYDPTTEAARIARQSSEQRVEALGLVAGGIAHDFNNQLVSVLAEASAAREDTQLGEATRESLRRIEAAANRMAQLTRQLLAYAGRGRFVSEVLDPDQLLREARDTLAHGVQDGIELVIEPRAGVVAIEADRNLLIQLLGNLVANAAEAQRGQGRIEIVTSTNSDGDGIPRWQLQLRDRGVGMDPDTIARIWDPFFTTKQNHHGLGLSAVVGIVRRLGGEITVESQPTVGATFTVRLPVVSGVRARAARGSGSPVTSSAQHKATSLRGMRVLIADDEPSVRSTIRRLLERRDATVVLASDGIEAKAMLEEGDYAFVVLDVMMPGLTGYQLVPIARSSQPDAKLMLMSGFTDVALGGGDAADGFLEKPFTSKAFEDAIDDLVRKR